MRPFAAQASGSATSHTQQPAPPQWVRIADDLPWPVLLAACAILLVDFGIAFGSAVFFPAVQASLRMPGWHLTALFSASSAVYLCLGLLSGPVADRRGASWIIAAGQCVLLIGLTTAASARSEMVFAIGYVTAVGGGIGLAYVPTLTVAQLRAPAHAPLAAGIAGAGVGLGAVVGAPVCGFLSEGFGWRVGLVVAGSVAVAAAVVTATALAPRASGNSSLPATVERRSARPQTLVQPATRDVGMGLLYGGYALIAMVAFVPFTGLIDLGHENGWRPHTAIVMIGVIGAGSAVGRFVLGGVAEQFGACRTTCACGLTMGLTISLMAVSSLPSAFAGSAFVFGAGYGGMSALTGPTVAEAFGRADLGRSVGRMMTAWALGLLTGPWLAALANERFGEHHTTWLACAALSIASAWLFFRATPQALSAR
jgi:MFS transporter, OFA family, oxalate/formate antiporter